MLILYLAPTTRAVCTITAEWLFLLRVIVGIYWLSFLDLLDPEDESVTPDDPDDYV